MPSLPNSKSELGFSGRVARAFIDSKLTPLIIINSVLLGAVAILLLPREEEPQIKVPMMDVLVSMPGCSAKEVEERATRPVSYTHLRAHETPEHLVCRLLLEKKK